MSLLETIWFILAILIILLVDPKSSVYGLSNNTLLSGFSSPSSKQSFIYTLSAVLIATFFILTVIISFIG
jgi:hypothetical protein